MTEWKDFSKASREVRSCYHEQIVPPQLGESIVKIGSMQNSLVLFWFENGQSCTVPIKYRLVSRP
jgi:hypothetical protein